MDSENLCPIPRLMFYAQSLYVPSVPSYAVSNLITVYQERITGSFIGLSVSDVVFSSIVVSFFMTKNHI